jgi:hypothetical protein
MASKHAKPRRNDTAAPAPGNEPDLVKLGAHESRNATPDAPPKDPARVNSEMRRTQDYQGL